MLEIVPPVMQTADLLPYANRPLAPVPVEVTEPPAIVTVPEVASTAAFSP